MATTIALLEAKLSADTSAYRRDMSRAETTTQKASQTIKKAAFLAGAAVATGLGVAAKVGWDEFAQGQKVAAQTNAVLKSTGGVANVTAKEVSDLATSIMKKTGIDDEAIASGENMLLTFKNIRDETGKGNDIFTQSTKVLTDMTVALGTEPQKQAIQLGKALNDPVKGISALTRVGVTFSDKQKETIKRLVETGDKAGAQKIILKELTSEFGGSAEAAGKTLPGQLSILRESLKNTAGDIVKKLMPTLQDLVEWANKNLPKALEIAEDAFDQLWDAIKPVWEITKDLIGFLDEHRTTFKVLATALGIFTGALLTHKAALKVATTWTNLMKDANLLLNFVLKGNPYVRIALLIIAIGTALVTAYKKSERFREVVHAVFDATKSIVRTVVSFILGKLSAFLGGIADVMEAASHLPIVGDQFKGIAEKVRNAQNRIDDMKDSVNGIPKKKTMDVTVNFKFYAKSWQYGWSSDAQHGMGDIAAADAIRQGVRQTAGPGIRSGIRSLSFQVGGAPVKDIDPRLWGEIGMGRSMGLSVASGYRPGATVAGSGGKSDHSYFPSKAVDMAGSPFNMARFAHAVAGSSGIDTVIYSPIGLWKAGSGWGGITSATTKRDHYDHVHVDTFDRGGWLPPRSSTLAINRTSSWEPVGPPGRGGLTVNFNGTVVGGRRGMDEITAMIEAAFTSKQRNGGTLGFS